MKRYLLGAFALIMILQCACAPKQPASSSSDTRPPTAADLLPGPSQDASSQPDEAPDPEVAARWEDTYRSDAQVLGKTLAQITQEDDMAVLGLWPDGRTYVGTETTSLLFSGPAGQSDAVCAAAAVALRQETTVPALRQEWGDCLIFSNSDPVAGPCWAVTAGALTYRFRTDASGETLVQENCLVLSLDSLLPQSPSLDWLIPARTWPSYWVEAPGEQWDPAGLRPGPLLQRRA